jgi:hypothetical protein
MHGINRLICLILVSILMSLILCFHKTAIIRLPSTFPSNLKTETKDWTINLS